MEIKRMGWAVRIALASAALWSAAPGAGSGAAAAAASGDPALRWSDVAAAIEAHPALRAAAAEVEEAAGAVAAARQLPNPSLGAALGRSEAVAGPESDAIWELELTLPLVAPGVRGGTIDAARADRDAAAHEAAALRLEVRRRLGEAFWRVVHDRERLASLARTAAQMDSLVAVARVRVEMGEARPLELGRIEVEAARVAAAAAAAAEAARARRDVLNLWLGSRLPEGFAVAGELSELPPLPPAGEAVAEAAARHPQVLAAGSRLSAAAARVGAARGARLPDLAIGGFYERELDARAWGGRLELSLPLWNWNGGEIRRARAAEAAARHRRDLAATEVAAAARESHAAAAAALAGARALRDEVLPRARAAAAALEEMYRVGEVGVIDVLDARRELTEIEGEALDAWLEARLARLQLATFTGEVSDE